MRKRPDVAPSLLDDPTLRMTAMSAARPFVAVQEAVLRRIEEALSHTKEFERIRNIWPDGIDTSIMAAKVIARLAARCADAVKDMVTPQPATPGRRSTIHLATAVTLMAIGSLLAKVNDMLQPLEQSAPVAYGATLAARHSYLPSPDGDLDQALMMIDSVEGLYEFINKRIDFAEPTFPMEFLRTYHRPPVPTPEGKLRGCCNTIAYSIGSKWARQRGIPCYEVSIWPKNPADRTHKSWHQLLVICMEQEDANGRPLILPIDATRKPQPRRQTIDEYLGEVWPTMEVMPVGGVIPSLERQDNILARFRDHMKPNATRLQHHTFADQHAKELTLQ